jgi:hypothetical protein
VQASGVSDCIRHSSVGSLAEKGLSMAYVNNTALQGEIVAVYLRSVIWSCFREISYSNNIFINS